MTATRPQTKGVNPRVKADMTAFRAGCGRYTVDIVLSDRGVLAIAGDGVGRQPATAKIGVAVAAAVLQLADVVDERTAFETAAWPLVET